MNKAMTIEEFHALLTTESEKDDNPLLKALRKLMATEEPEDITALAEDDPDGWSDWRAV